MFKSVPVIAMQTAHIATPPHLDGTEADTLMLELVRRYADPERYGDLPRQSFLNAFYDLIDLVNQRTKAEMVTILCRMQRTPRAVAHYLSLEPVEIGGQMLLHSPSLGNLDLLRIAHAGTHQHKALIAERRAAHDCAYEAAASVQIEQADDRVGDRTDNRHADTSAAILKAAARGGRLTASNDAARQTSSSGDHTPRRPLDIGDFRRSLHQAARDEDEAAIVRLLGARFDLSYDVVTRITNDPSGDAFAVLLKSDETPAAEAHRLQILLFDTVGSDTANAIRAMRVYEALTVEECRRSVASWRKPALPSQSDHEPAPRRESHAEAMLDRYGSAANADRPAQVDIEHRRYAF